MSAAGLVRTVAAPPDDMVEVFREPRFDRSPSWISRAAHEVGRWFDAIPFGTAGRFLAWLTVALVVAFALRSAVLAVRRAIARRRQRGGALDEVVVDVTARSPEEWRAEGERRAEEQDWKEAIRCRYAEVVALLFAHGRAVDQPGRTTGELRRDVERSTPPCAAAFGEITDVFELVWFANRPATREAHDRLRSLGETIGAALAPHEPVAATR